MDKLIKISALIEKNKIKKIEELDLFVQICQLLENKACIKLNDICVRFGHPTWKARKIIHKLRSHSCLIEYYGSLGFMGMNIKLTKKGKNLKRQLLKITK